MAVYREYSIENPQCKQCRDRVSINNTECRYSNSNMHDTSICVCSDQIERAYSLSQTPLVVVVYFSRTFGNSQMTCFTCSLGNSSSVAVQQCGSVHLLLDCLHTLHAIYSEKISSPICKRGLFILLLDRTFAHKCQRSIFFSLHFLSRLYLSKGRRIFVHMLIYCQINSRGGTTFLRYEFFRCYLIWWISTTIYT